MGEAIAGHPSRESRRSSDVKRVSTTVPLAPPPRAGEWADPVPERPFSRSRGAKRQPRCRRDPVVDVIRVSRWLELRQFRPVLGPRSAPWTSIRRFRNGTRSAPRAWNTPLPHDVESIEAPSLRYGYIACLRGEHSSRVSIMCRSRRLGMPIWLAEFRAVRNVGCDHFVLTALAARSDRSALSGCQWMNAARSWLPSSARPFSRGDRWQGSRGRAFRADPDCED